MNKLLLVMIFAVFAGLGFRPFYAKEGDDQSGKTKQIDSIIPSPELSETQSLYDSLQLQSLLNYEAFEQAMMGYKTISVKNKDILTVIDFTLPSTEKRMYVLDMKNKKLLFHTIVAHGRNSGEKYATKFSNKHGSLQSSLGFYLTDATYQGGNGYSLRLAGLERGINDQAMARAVVIHGADYCSENVIRTTGRLGRSYGCPALPRELNKPIIDTIKNGSLLFIYAGSKAYMASSKVFKNADGKPSKTMLAQREEPAHSGQTAMGQSVN
ncbi:murein L,D-transpeptidase catalytic domain family protein [Parapedobacter koreensis]|uniref:L,D-transpeptidase catalytic domain n=1 Tax=Parapedobacter koreensis TaxID=332977 RepID=A0A1H7QSF3_9SPHI|nr:murein L,D-transpeptidase catalytic domain family protein [Parapedobacter koreensis]SEL50555.1 L,D-transpeptidase catalytic domain [Parapedobacter koreensis]